MSAEYSFGKMQFEVAIGSSAAGARRAADYIG